MHHEDGSRILARLERHKGAFNLSGQLGADLLNVAVDGVKETFAREEDPDGTRWARLTEKYGAWKERTHPGQQINVLTDDMRNGLDGVVETAEDYAKYQAGQTEFQRQKIAGSHKPPDDSNRMPRKFVGLTEASIEESRQTLTYHLGEVL